MSITQMTAEAKAASAAAVAAANANKKTGATDDAGKMNEDFTFFLKMLTTQLKNQDPTEPMDVSQMTQQIAQYSGVEQQIKTNKSLEALLNANKQSQMSTAVSYIGKEIETEGNSGSLTYAQGTDGKAYGQATFSYILPAGTQSAKIVITDKNGGAVFSGNGTLKNGRNVVVWDGINSLTGKQMEPGTYTINVTAKDAAGKDFNPDTRAVGVVDTVETDANGDLILNVGDVQVKYNEILAVREATPFYVPATGGEEGEEDTASTGNDTGTQTTENTEETEGA